MSATETIGILYAGELGAALGGALVSCGARVVSTCAGRSDRTAARCARAGLEALSDVSDVVAQSEIIVSLVPPASSLELAGVVARAAGAIESRRIYVEANSIAPDSARAISTLFDATPIDVVDASIHGLASRFESDVTLYLSGEASDRVAAIFGRAVRVQVVGKEVGAASMQKMLLGGVSKGMVALFLEMSTVALEANLLDEFLESCDRYYPGVVEVMERLVPTVPRHAARRAQEMSELESAIRSMGLRPGFASEARRLLAILGRSGASESGASETGSTDAPASAGALRSWIESIGGQHPLHADDDEQGSN